MALKGKKLDYAVAVVAAKPRKLSYTEVALSIGCPRKSVHSAASRFSSDPDVQEYIYTRWRDYYDDQEQRQIHSRIAARQNAGPVVRQQAVTTDFAQIKEWVEQEPADSADFLELAHLLCQKMGATTDPMKYWDSVLISPHAEAKEKAQAAAEKAKYTLAKPAAQNKKETKFEKAQKLRQQQIVGNQSDFKGKVPKWTT